MSSMVISDKTRLIRVRIWKSDSERIRKYKLVFCASSHRGSLVVKFYQVIFEKIGFVFDWIAKLFVPPKLRLKHLQVIATSIKLFDENE